ncbi:MAG: aldo/keto reductase [Anaerolineales bacterium]|nr:aldo/keto reductase [Anaerolineales bacterium]
MQKRPFGSNKLNVTPIGIGLAALGRPGYINLGHAADLESNYAVATMEAHAHSVLDAAWAAGIRYFDAARSYGRAEQFLASWLNARAIDPTEITVGSKWGYTYTADWQVNAAIHEVKDHSITVLNRQIAESREQLSAYLDLYQIHSATLDSGVLENTAVLRKLADLRNSGLCIGLSLSGPQQADTLYKALEINYDERPLFGAVQATWNVLAQEAGTALNAAHQQGLGVIVKEAVANGRLTSRNSNPEFQSKRAVLGAFATTKDTTIDAIAIAYVLAQPWASVVLSGAANVAHLQSNITALNVNLDSEMLEQLARLSETPSVYWSTRSQLTWN